MMFYAPDMAETQILPADEARHCLRVLRMGKGDAVNVTDGKGRLYKTVIKGADVNNCTLAVTEVITAPKHWTGFVELAVAPTKNLEKMKWMAEKIVEIGVDCISFINCKFSERREINIEPIRRVMIAAMKQSQKVRLPKLNEIVNFDAFAGNKFDGQKFIAHFDGGEKPTLAKACPPKSRVRIMIGPEGGFSKEEVKLSEKNGFTTVSLGKARLRTETAAIIACQTVHLLEELC
ncbi:MAG: 16S rRNA (uracil(1498)-N(3))-methyltransferase [Dysgonamonadaceae bacterium]|jgi:16S rRNA (uracil1498-N3)-methyltransferase|nr:16S rRNA (uracil(1498)-N(3))-methyltransferase [Dysgonamonadaceae bacterium]